MDIGIDPTSTYGLDHVQDDFVRAVMAAFADADYEGDDAVPLRAVQSCDVLDGMSTDLVNEALVTAQRAGLIVWDEERIGSIRLSETGRKKFRLVRDSFFDANSNRALRLALGHIDPTMLQSSDAYRDIRASCTGLGVSAGQPCPVAGRWLARRLNDMALWFREGDLLPYPACDALERRVTWYLVSADER